MVQVQAEQGMEREPPGMNRDLPDNVVSIETKWTEAPPIEPKPWDYMQCRHEHTWLDPKLRTVGCRDCGEERLDPYEVLLYLASEWSSWKREADKLRELNAEYRTNQRDKWVRSCERHLNAHPDHHALHFLTDADGSVIPRDRGTIPRDCRQCASLVIRFDSRWIVKRGLA